MYKLNKTTDTKYFQKPRTQEENLSSEHLLIKLWIIYTVDEMLMDAEDEWTDVFSVCAQISCVYVVHACIPFGSSTENNDGSSKILAKG